MPNSEGIFITAGAVAFLGNMKEAGGFPENGVTTITATTVLTVIAALSRNTPIESPFRAFAWLVLLAAIYRYVPGLYKESRKSNG